MPTILRFGGFRVVVYPNDHRPEHVHVIGHGNEALFELHCPSGPASLRENYGFSRRDVAPIQDSLTENLSALCAAWESIHGIA